MGDYGPVQARPVPPAAAVAMVSPPPLPNPQFALVRPPDVVDQQQQRQRGGGACYPARMPPPAVSAGVAVANPVMQPQPDVIQDSRLEKQPSPMYMNEEEAGVAGKLEAEQQPTYMNEEQEISRGTQP